MANQKKLQLQGFKFKPFSNKQMSILSFWQDNSPVADKFMIVADGSIRSGKSQPYWARIYTPDGYKLMGDIKVGDYVLDRQGKPTKVLGIFPQGKLPVYKITFHDGSVAYSSREHLWTYNTVFDADDEFCTTTLGELIDTSSEYYYKYRFPLNGCVEFVESPVAVSPRKMGLFLGCDDLANNIVYSGNRDELYEYVLKFGCDFDNRWIPNEYKYNSVDVRRKVLVGLLEAGGIVYTNTPTIQFKSSSSQLMLDITELARSLGLFVDSQNDLVFIEVDAELMEMFHEPFRKRLKLEGNRLEKWRVPISIEYFQDTECQCIYVDNEEHLYLTDDFVVTHNTVCMVLSFVLFVMTHFNQQNAAMCGKSVGSFRRNVLMTLKQMMISLEYEVIEHRSENYVEIIKDDVVNYFYIFGGKDESSQDLIQGLTLCGLLLDEVALMPRSFFEQATARLSIEGAKVFCNCNPSSQYHWFYTEVLSKLREKDGLYVHFTMDDNLSLSDEIKDRYAKMYSGVFKKRYIEGKWCVAEGLIYDMLSEENIVEPDDIPYENIHQWCIGVDYGTGNSTVFELAGKTDDGEVYVCKEYYFAGRLEAQANGDYDAQKTDLEFSEDMKKFITENYNLTERVYRSGPNGMPIVVDPAAASFILQLRRHRMKVTKADNSVLDGIRTVASMLGAKKLKISTECSNLIDEMHGYMWDSKAQAIGVDKPIKQNDHACDALRYLMMKFKDGTKISNATRNIGW